MQLCTKGYKIYLKDKVLQYSYIFLKPSMAGMKRYFNQKVLQGLPQKYYRYRHF